MRSVEVQSGTTCHHCSEDCDDTIKLGDLFFCCYGCRAVHELLEESQLSDAYLETHLENQSYSRLKAERKYAFLDNEDILNELVAFRDDNMTVVKLLLPDIHCSSCIYLLEHLPKLERAILRSEIHFVRRELTVHFDQQRKSLKEIAVLLSQLGYPPHISLDSLDKTKQQIHRGPLNAKIAVAGFCFGNLMLLSMPEYLDHNFLLTDNFQSLFGWISLGLAIPLVAYSGSEYFTRAYKGLKHGSFNIDVPIALGILTLFLRSAFEILSSTGAGYFDSLGGLIFFLLIGKWYQSKTYQALSFERDYASYFPVSVTCLIDGEEFHRPLKSLKKGDIVVLHNQELIPADGVLQEGVGHIDYSFVTGESQLLDKAAGQKVYAGGRQTGPEIRIKLLKDVNNSELTRLWNTDVFKKEQQPLKNWIDRISKYFTVAILMIAMCTSIYWWIIDASKIWLSVSSVLIVACPCALALALPFAYGHAMRLLGKHGFYLKTAEVVEGLSKIKDIVFDKTGTLTASTAQAKYEGDRLNQYQTAVIKSVLINSNHPISRTILKGLSKCEKLPVEAFEELMGQGIRAEVNGHEIKIGSADFVGSRDSHRINTTTSYVSFDGNILGRFTIRARYRPGIFALLDRLKMSACLHLLSGDNDSESERLAAYFHKMFFDRKPKQKLNYLTEMKRPSLMVGDGLNDAGALKKADVGVAIAEDVHQFSPACDAILSAPKLVEMDKYLFFSKQVVRVVLSAFVLSFLYNIVGISFAVSGQLTPLVSAVLMPLSSVTVVLFVTLSVKLLWRRVSKDSSR